MTCSLCDRPVHGRGMCNMHYHRWWKQGNADTDLRYRLKPDPTYRTVHTRLDKKRGKAASYPCVACGQPARHWAYKYGGDGNLSYSDDLNEYEPRCVPCHWKLDKPPRPLCSVEGCERPHCSRGMCTKHYQRWYKKKRVANRNTSTNEEK